VIYQKYQVLVFSTQFSRAAHHLYCYSRSCSSENGTSELVPSSLQMKKRPKGSMKHSWKNVPTIHISYPYCSVYKVKMNVTKRTVQRRGLLTIGHINGRPKGNLNKLKSQTAEYATNPCFTPVLHVFCCNVPGQFTPFLNLHSPIFSLTPFCYLHFILVTPYF
jgi:hypothetical protein